MPQGLSAVPPTVYAARPGERPTQGRPAAGLSTHGRVPKKRAAQRLHCSQLGNGAARTAATLQTAGGSRTKDPPRSQRHHERVDRLRQDSSG